MKIEDIDLTGKCSLESELIEILEYFNLTVRPIFHNPESLSTNCGQKKTLESEISHLDLTRNS